MSHELEIIRNHYQAAIANPQDLLSRIDSALSAMEGPITAQKTANFDQFHLGGLASSAELASRLSINSATHVLDAGSGLGGPSRYLSETFGCTVTGVDLAPDYVAIAQLLAEKAGLARRINYLEGNITNLPFPDESFDLVWTQHVVMNVRDRDGLYREIRRVLKAGGHFAFYDPYLPIVGDHPLYPTPWADASEHSTLLSKEETIASCAQACLQLQVWDDVSGLAKGWMERQQQQIQQIASVPDRSTLSPAWVVGTRMQQMVANFARNVREGRIRLVMGICVAT